MEENVVIGDDCWIGNHVSLLKGTRMGKGCKIYHGVVMGGTPQDLKFKEGETTVNVGDQVTIREYVTVNRGSQACGKTEVGDAAYLMAYVHVAHDCWIGKGVIIANTVQLGGRVTVGDWVMIGGIVAVHQFCRIGRHAFVGGGYRVVQDIPPYIVAAGEPLKFRGLNSVGLRRHGFSQEIRRNIKQAYRLIYRSSLNLGQAIEKIKKELPLTEEIEEIISFVEKSERGLI